MFDPLSLREIPILLWFQDVLRNHVTDPIVSLFTHLGDAGLLFILLTLALLFHPKTRRVGLAAACGLLFSLLFTNGILKHLFGRVRPWVDFPALIPLVKEGDPNSFPSGHSSAAFAFALAVSSTAQRRWMRVAAPVLALFMALSRLYVGVHYPTDVLAGALVGALAGLLGAWLAKYLLAHFPKKKTPSL